MEHSELFLLLPKYEDIKESPEYILSHKLIEESEIMNLIECIYKLCDFIVNENYKGYYDAKNVEAFLYPVQVISDCYPNVATRMRVVLSKFGENWRMQKRLDTTEYYMYYCLSIKDDTLCEITERKAISNDASTFLLINLDALKCCTDFIRTKRGKEEIELDVRNADRKSIIKWYSKNRRPQRIFNINPKHGENGRGAHHNNKGNKVSLLKCSKSHAQQLLHEAVGVDCKTLYSWDEKYSQYIEFKCETANTYHGFHLNAEDETRIPKDIKSILNN